jgi:hypothetical protein
MKQSECILGAGAKVTKSQGRQQDGAISARLHAMHHAERPGSQEPIDSSAAILCKQVKFPQLMAERNGHGADKRHAARPDRLATRYEGACRQGHFTLYKSHPLDTGRAPCRHGPVRALPSLPLQAGSSCSSYYYYLVWSSLAGAKTETKDWERGEGGIGGI